MKKELKALIKKIKTSYPFLEGITIDVVDYGTTHFDAAQNSIILSTDHAKDLFETPRFTKRLGKIKSLYDFTVTILLHEIYHVHQNNNVEPEKLKKALLKIQDGDEKSHDKSWIERDADRWAKKEAKKWLSKS
jgi:hypothetical protein